MGQLASPYEIEMFWIKKARASPLHFMHYISKMKPPRHMYDWTNQALLHKLVNLISSRSMAKTTWATYFLTWFIAKNPLSSNLLVAVTAEISVKRIEMMKSIMQMPEFKNVFPNIEIDSNRSCTSTEFSLRDNSMPYSEWLSLVVKHGDPKNPTFMAIGATSNLIGFRTTGYIFVDDIHSEINTRTTAQRMKTINWFLNTVMNAQTPSSRVLVIGTRWAEEDDLPYFLENLTNENNEKVWHTIYLPIINEKGESNWPEFWPLDRIAQKRAEVGESIFQLAFMLNPNAATNDSQFREKDLQDAPTVFDSAIYESIVISTDFALTHKSYSDYSVFTVIGRTKDEDYEIHVLDYYMLRADIDRMLGKFFEKCNEWMIRYPIDHILYEKQALTLPLVDQIIRASPNYPMRGVPLKGSDKFSRASGLLSKSQNKKLYINKLNQQWYLAKNQILPFPSSGVKDDFVDTMSLPLHFWTTVRTSSSYTKVENAFFI